MCVRVKVFVSTHVIVNQSPQDKHFHSQHFTKLHQYILTGIQRDTNYFLQVLEPLSHAYEDRINRKRNRKMKKTVQKDKNDIMVLDQ